MPHGRKTSIFSCIVHYQDDSWYHKPEKEKVALSYTKLVLNYVKICLPPSNKKGPRISLFLSLPSLSISGSSMFLNTAWEEETIRSKRTIGREGGRQGTKLIWDVEHLLPSFPLLCSHSEMIVNSSLFLLNTHSTSILSKYAHIGQV